MLTSKETSKLRTIDSMWSESTCDRTLFAIEKGDYITLYNTQKHNVLYWNEHDCKRGTEICKNQR